MNFSKKLCGSLLLFSLAFMSCKQDKEPEAVPETTIPQEAITPEPSPAPPSDTMNTPAANNTAGVKLNPPHGEPGHRCEIPVGAPLDSKPNTGGAQAQQQQAQPQNFMMANPQQTQAQAPAQNQGEKPANNPAHGQPFHRCDIAVGAPLP